MKKTKVKKSTPRTDKAAVYSAVIDGVPLSIAFEQMDGAVKFDQGKPRYDLMSEDAIEGLAKVLGFGANKYTTPTSSGEDNWRKGMEWRRLIRSALGHILSFSRGEDLDPESKLPHIDHAAACVHFLSEYQKRGLGTDNRYKRPVKK